MSARKSLPQYTDFRQLLCDIEELNTELEGFMILGVRYTEAGVAEFNTHAKTIHDYQVIRNNARLVMGSKHIILSMDENSPLNDISVCAEIISHAMFTVLLYSDIISPRRKQWIRQSIPWN